MYSLTFSSFFPFIPSSFPFLFSLVALVLANDTSPIGNVFSLTVHLTTDISSQSTSALLLTSSLLASPSPSTLDLFSIFYSHLHFLHLLFLHLLFLHLLFNLIIISPLAICYTVSINSYHCIAIFSPNRYRPLLLFPLSLPFFAPTFRHFYSLHLFIHSLFCVAFEREQLQSKERERAREGSLLPSVHTVCSKHTFHTNTLYPNCFPYSPQFCKT
ncbi:hypothetical protein K457DRAFT_1468401 [Linnemannia elongata AG-77]|uniref:Uncharacterized protein n=1 Tax=Linnemannia elongata AG-77 TaxID=1314771 RepID=A0A197JQX5_9FUNG|nr:hypothetical protein K457DRAFT_1468401 [Linnemannia elongata AG-77]